MTDTLNYFDPDAETIHDLARLRAEQWQITVMVERNGIALRFTVRDAQRIINQLAPSTEDTP